MGMVNKLTEYNIAISQPGLQELRFPIHYGKAVAVAYQNVIKFLIQRDRSLNCLELCGQPPICTGLPSWAIDWSS